jgi:hypothetical protein
VERDWLIIFDGLHSVSLTEAGRQRLKVARKRSPRCRPSLALTKTDEATRSSRLPSSCGVTSLRPIGPRG